MFARCVLHVQQQATTVGQCANLTKAGNECDLRHNCVACERDSLCVWDKRDSVCLTPGMLLLQNGVLDIIEHLCGSAVHDVDTACFRNTLPTSIYIVTQTIEFVKLMCVYILKVVGNFDGLISAHLR